LIAEKKLFLESRQKYLPLFQTKKKKKKEKKKKITNSQPHMHAYGPVLQNVRRPLQQYREISIGRARPIFFLFFS